MISEVQKTLYLERIDIFKKRIDNQIFGASVTMEATFAHSVEPTPFNQRFDLDFKPISESEEWGEAWEWRGIRTATHTYARYLSGETFLFDNHADPWQQDNLIKSEDNHELATDCEKRLQELMVKRNDALHPGSFYRDWLDDERRVVRNASGPLGDPEREPDFSLL